MICIKNFVTERAVDFITILFFVCYYMEQIAHLNESNEELRMKQWCLYLHSSFPFFQDYATKAEIIWSYYHLSSEDQNKKNI